MSLCLHQSPYPAFATCRLRHIIALTRVLTPLCFPELPRGLPNSHASVSRHPATSHLATHARLSCPFLLSLSYIPFLIGFLPVAELWSRFGVYRAVASSPVCIGRIVFVSCGLSFPFTLLSTSYYYDAVMFKYLTRKVSQAGTFTLLLHACASAHDCGGLTPLFLRQNYCNNK